MMMEEPMIQMVTEAYDKLKSYVYYDNFSLDLRVKLAAYEGEIENNLENLAKEVEKFIEGGESAYLDSLINKIGYQILPKKFTKDEFNGDIFYISNINEKQQYTCKDVTYFIDCHVDLHIISFMWVLHIGHDHDMLLGDHCYAYRMAKRTGKKIWHKKVFPRYFEKYQFWRDNALKAAKQLHSANEDVAIISLDIRRYYDSVDLDILQKYSIDDDYLFLNLVLAEVHEKYRLLRGTENKLLPIGLVSSGMLANFYLSPLDEAINEEINPKFYGRYVDDLLLVISKPEIIDDPMDFIKNQLEKKGVLTEKNNNYIVSIDGHSLDIQKEKFKIYHFKASEPITLLDEFRRTIRENSSEFKFLPEVNNLFSDFTTKSINISYSDTINKIRSIEGINHNKYGASKHLANILFVLKNTNHVRESLLSTINDQINDIFQGQRSLELNGLWEKVFTIFTINKDDKRIIEFVEYTVKLIAKIENKDRSRLQKSLSDHLANSLSMAVSLNYPFFKENIFERIKNRMNNVSLDLEIDFSFIAKIEGKTVKIQAQNLIQSNLFRHNYLQFPLLGLCRQQPGFSFRDSLLSHTVSLEINNAKAKFFPKFIQYHELESFYILKSLWKNIKQKTRSFIVEEYKRLNKLSSDDVVFPFSKKTNGNAKGVRTIDVTTELSQKHKYKISIVNIEIDPENSKANYLNKPNLSYMRMSDINHILNLSAKEGADLIVFPEIAIPFQWLNHVADFARKHDIAIICGIEHIANKKKEVFNYSATVLPFNHGGFNNVLTDLRLKIDYSPEEIRQIEGRKHTIPARNKDEKLRIYKWKGCIFTVFNCFELTDISKRSKFKGAVDFVVAIEHNQDTEYFSNITESVSRDIHAYVIQVNSSHFGDSRITQPAKSFKKDIVRIKGGINTTILTDVIDIQELRKFQNKKYSLQKEHEYLKPTPPNFVMDKDRKVY